MRCCLAALPYAEGLESNSGDDISCVKSSYLLTICSSLSNMKTSRPYYDSGAGNGSPVCGSSFRDSFNASIATSSCLSSGSCVVMFCSHTPGFVISLKNQLLSFFADKRMISYERPATTGISAMRIRKLNNNESNLITENSTIATSITTIRKLVPQRGCCRGCGRAFSTVSGNPASHVKTVLCSAPWY